MYKSASKEGKFGLLVVGCSKVKATELGSVPGRCNALPASSNCCSTAALVSVLLVRQYTKRWSCAEAMQWQLPGQDALRAHTPAGSLVLGRNNRRIAKRINTRVRTS